MILFLSFFLNSIRANQHNETLQAQYLLIQQQRDDIAMKLSQAEDRESRNQAALVNLQCALEQFQRGEILFQFLAHLTLMFIVRVYLVIIINKHDSV